MQCPQCQHDNPAGARFCNDCGAKLAATCPRCGQVNPPGSRFCNSCGRELAAAAPATAAPPPPSPRSYTPAHLAERILTSRGALADERKQVTVLFADLVRSTELIAGLDPEQVRALIDPALHLMRAAVHRYEGFVNETRGDGIMALFGAPLAHEDHAVRACYAALALQEAMRAQGEEARRRHGVPLQARVGLNSGEVVVRAIESDLRLEYTAIGETVNLAARMEQLATSGATCLTAATLQLAEGLVQVRALGPTPVKGFAAPVEVFELVGVGATRTRFQAAAARGLTRFVGRDAELETLRRTLERAGSGHGQVVALVGEPGVGKSRLVWEFAHSHRAQGWLVLETRSVSYGKATSYLPVIDLLKAYCSIDAYDDPRRVREKLTGKLLTLDSALGSTLPALLALLDVPVEDPTWQALDPPQRRRRTLDALKRLLLRESQEQPLLVVFEDLHWIDSETQALLDSLVESLPTAHLLLLVNYRPEYTHSWASKTYYGQLRLDPLPTASAAELLDALLGSEASVAPLKRLLIERTEGNPFFLEESVRTLVETGALTGVCGAYRCAQSIPSAQVPATVQAVLAARIDRLAPEDKRLLQAAAVIGKDVPYPLLQAIAELPEDALRQGLARLQAAEFLYETTLFPELEYTFKHALTHEVAYGSLLQERRRALHAEIVVAIERLYTGHLSEHIERLAHHAVRGELWEKAVTNLRQAGAKTATRSAHRAAADYFEQALTVITRLPDSRAVREQAIDMRFELRNALLPLMEQERIVQLLGEAESLAEALGDRRRLGWVAVYLGTYAYQTGDILRGVELGRTALANAEVLGDLAMTVAANWALAPACAMHGDYHDAARRFEQNINLIPVQRLHDSFGLPFIPAVQARGLLALFCLAELGEFGKAVVSAEEAVRIAEAANHPFSTGAASYQRARTYHLKGDFDRAIPLLEQYSQWEHVGARWVYADLAYAYAQLGQIERASALLEQPRPARPPVYPARFNLPIRLGQAHLLVGRLDDASAYAAQATSEVRIHHLRGGEAWAQWLLGEIAAAADPPDTEQAEPYYRQALARAEELGMRPLAAHCHLGLGTLYQRVGKNDQAQGELTAAVEMYRSMEMTFWLAKAEAALAQVTD